MSGFLERTISSIETGGGSLELIAIDSCCTGHHHFKDICAGMQEPRMYSLRLRFGSGTPWSPQTSASTAVHAYSKEISSP